MPSRELTRKAQKHKKQLENLYKVKYIWYFIWYDLWDKAGKGASSCGTETENEAGFPLDGVETCASGGRSCFRCRSSKNLCFPRTFTYRRRRFLASQGTR